MKLSSGLTSAKNFVLCTYENQSSYEMRGWWWTLASTNHCSEISQTSCEWRHHVPSTKSSICQSCSSCSHDRPKGTGDPLAGCVDSWNPFCVSSADERFDATFHTNVLVNSSGHCQYLPPGKIYFLRQFWWVWGASLDGCHVSGGHLLPHSLSPLPAFFHVCLYIFPEHDDAIFPFFVTGSWLNLSSVACPYWVPCVL